MSCWGDIEPELSTTHSTSTTAWSSWWKTSTWVEMYVPAPVRGTYMVAPSAAEVSITSTPESACSAWGV